MLQQLPFTILFTVITNISSISPQGSCIYPSKMEPTPTVTFFPTGVLLACNRSLQFYAVSVTEFACVLNSKIHFFDVVHVYMMEEYWARELHRRQYQDDQCQGMTCLYTTVVWSVKLSLVFL